MNTRHGFLVAMLALLALAACGGGETDDREQRKPQITTDPNAPICSMNDWAPKEDCRLP